MEQEKITFIKKDAIIPIKVGAGFVSRLQQALIFLIEDKTDEEVTEFTSKLQDKDELEGWMLHYETLALLLKEIEESAKTNNMTEDKVME